MAVILTKTQENWSELSPFGVALEYDHKSMLDFNSSLQVMFDTAETWPLQWGRVWTKGIIFDLGLNFKKLVSQTRDKQIASSNKTYVMPNLHWHLVRGMDNNP